MTESLYRGEQQRVHRAPVLQLLGEDRGCPVRDGLCDGLQLEEDTVVPAVLKQVLALEPGHHILVRLTATKLVGELCTQRHSNYIPSNLNYCR